MSVVVDDLMEVDHRNIDEYCCLPINEEFHLSEPDEYTNNSVENSWPEESIIRKFFQILKSSRQKRES